jgi:hypothetical protein
MFMTTFTRPLFTHTTYSFLLFNLDIWEFHFNLLLCIIYICACISFWLISFYLWLVLVFLFNRDYYGFTPLEHCSLRHYTSWHVATTHSFSMFLKLIKTAMIHVLGYVENKCCFSSICFMNNKCTFVQILIWNTLLLCMHKSSSHFITFHKKLVMTCGQKFK